MKSKLGQNFLIDKNIAEKEVDFADLRKDDIVLEIGPGKGIITRLLSEKAKKVIAIEIDSKLAKDLENKVSENVQIINQDALGLDFKKIDKFNKIVSNLPYQISSPITFKFLEYDFEKAILIYQKEFAERMVAGPGSKDYSRLSVGVFYKSDCKILHNVSKKCFYPQPNVDSCIVELKPKSPPFFVNDEAFFFELTKNLFNHRRKKIGTVLRKFYKNSNFKNVPYIDLRIEELTPLQISEIANFLFDE